jgi:hypothetical protein
MQSDCVLNCWVCKVAAAMLVQDRSVATACILHGICTAAERLANQSVHVQCSVSLTRHCQRRSSNLQLVTSSMQQAAGRAAE